MKIYGLTGNKPARTFSVAERNVKEIKFRYHWRKKFWNAVAQLVRHTNAELAIERLGIRASVRCESTRWFERVLQTSWT